jgi:hypothetical protein
MKTRVLILTIVLLFSLVITSSVSAGKGPKLPKWEKVFDPVPYMGEETGTDAGVAFEGKLYFKFSAKTGDQVWASSDGKSWSFAWDANSIQEGYEMIAIPTVFKDQLYLAVGDAEELLPLQIMRTRDGRQWEAVVPSFEGWFSGGFTSFQGALYVGICDVIEDYHCRLWRSPSGDPGTWEEVAVFPTWNDISSFATFKGGLYVSSMFTLDEDGFTAAQIWRSFDGVNWEPVIMNGFGNPSNITTWSFGQKDGYLYVGTGGFEGGGDIWRTRDGRNWKPVTKDGLGNPNNLVFGFVTYQNLLYAYSVNFVDGCEVYSSKDGIHWTPANEPGWGDTANSVVWQDDARVIFKGDLYMGLWGPGGVWKLAKP